MYVKYVCMCVHNREILWSDTRTFAHIVSFDGVALKKFWFKKTSSLVCMDHTVTLNDNFTSILKSGMTKKTLCIYKHEYTYKCTSMYVHIYPLICLNTFHDRTLCTYMCVCVCVCVLRTNNESYYCQDKPTGRNVRNKTFRTNKSYICGQSWY